MIFSVRLYLTTKISTHASRSLRMTRRRGRIPPTSKTAKAVFVGFCSIPREPAQWAGLLRGDRRTGVLPTIECHPEQVRNVVVMATMETFFRTCRSFAEKARCIQRHKSSLHFDLYWPRAPFGAKPPQAGSTESLMYLAESKELFY